MTARPFEHVPTLLLHQKVVEHIDDVESLRYLAIELQGRPGPEPARLHEMVLGILEEEDSSENDDDAPAVAEDDQVHDRDVDPGPDVVPSDRILGIVDRARSLASFDEPEVVQEPVAAEQPEVEFAYSHENGSSVLPFASTNLRTPGSDRWKWQPPHLPRLRSAQSPEELNLHLAATEWHLDPAILIHSAEDIQGRRHWSEFFEPYEHQVRNLITFCRRAPVALIADDVGLGKTISAGLILSELMARGKVKRALVLCPKLLLPQWTAELSSKFRIQADHGVGSDLGRLSRGKTDVVVTTYASARARMPELVKDGYDMLVLDEAHKLRNLYSQSGAPQIAQVIQEALGLRNFRYVLMLTATPIHNRLWDLYSLVDLLATAKGHKNPLGDEDEFDRAYIEDAKWTARRLVEGRKDEFRRHVAQYMVRSRRADCQLTFPDRRVQTEGAKGARGENRLMELVGSLLGELSPLLQSSVAQALMSSPHALVGQLENMVSNGTFEAHRLVEARRHFDSVRYTGKEELLMKLLRQLAKEKPDWRVVIFTGRKLTQDRIGQILTDKFGPGTVGYIRGGGGVRVNQATIEAYSADPPRIHVIVSTDAGAEGVNLQAGNIVVNYDLPWNPMILEQRIGRVQRLGSKFAYVIVLNLVLRGSVEEQVVARLTSRLIMISDALGEIEGVLQALGDEEGEKVEAKIRDLVLDSLKGRDVSQTMRQLEESILRAKAIYEEEKGSVDRHLGTLDRMHNEGPRMPELQMVRPRLNEHEFTLGALRAEGGHLEQESESTWRLTRPGQVPELVHFDESRRPAARDTGYFGGLREGLYRSGRPAFEQLVGRWVDRAGHRVSDLGSGSPQDIQSVVDGWVNQVDSVEVTGIKAQPGSAGFQGQVTLRAASSVAHDKYEKLIEVDLTPEGVAAFEVHDSSDGSRVPTEFYLPELGEGLNEVVQSSVSCDRDIQGFSQFYMQRLTEEHAQAGGDRHLQEQAVSSFTPHISIEGVGAKGVRFHVVDIDVTYRLDGEGPYTSRIKAIPGAGQVLQQPDIAECELSGRRVPFEVLDACEITGKLAIAHLLSTSERSGRKAIPDHVVTCMETSRQLLDDEVAASDLSGALVDDELLRTSPMSGRRGLEREMTQCAFTQHWFLEDEVRQSQVSGQPFRMDEELTGGLASVTGHKSEFGQCEETQAWLLPGELGRSAVSGKLVRQDLLSASQKNPSRFGLESERATCSVTGRTLLIDEVSTCAITGAVAETDMMVASDRSKRMALSAHAVKCEKTDLMLLSDEVGTCSVSGDLVDERLLVSSSISGALALKEHFVPCAATGERVLPQELVECQVTGLRALPSSLHVCAVTGKRAIESAMVQSEVSKDWVLESEARYSESSGRAGTPAETIRCSWDGRQWLVDEGRPCSMTGAWIATENLIRGREHRDLLDLLQGPNKGQTPNSRLKSAIEALPSSDPLKNARKLLARLHPDGQAAAVVGEVGGFMGIGSRVVGRLFRRDPEWVPIAGTAVGKRKGRTWELVETVDGAS